LPQLRSEVGAHVPSGTLKPGPGRTASEVSRHQRARLQEAMVRVVAARSYEAVTVRELARVARVSTRAFYQHYSGKDECFLGAHRVVTSWLFDAIETAQAASPDRKERMHSGLAALISAWGAEPDMTRLMLIDAYAASPSSLEEARRVEGWIAWRIGVDPTVVAGLIGVVRSRLLSGRLRELGDLTGELNSWALSSSDLRGRGVKCSPPVPKHDAVDKGGGMDLASSGDLALLLLAAIKLTRAEGRERLTASKIAAAAGVSRRRFHAFFSTPADCLLMALEMKVREAILEADRAGAGGTTVAERVYRVAARLSERTSHDAIFAELGFDQIETFGPKGLRAQAMLLHEFGRLIARNAGSAQLPGEPTLYAYAGALWNALGAAIATHRTPRNAAAAAYFTVAPLVAQIENAEVQSLIEGEARETVQRGGRRSVPVTHR